MSDGNFLAWYHRARHIHCKSEPLAWLVKEILMITLLSVLVAAWYVGIISDGPTPI